MSKYINKRGYVIIKNQFNKRDVEDAIKDLTVMPFKCADYGDNTESFPVYLSNDAKLYMPKFYGIRKFGKAENKLPPHEKIDVQFNPNRQLRPHQVKPVEECIKAFADPDRGGGILAVPCAFGKTACACYLISVLKKKTLVIVHIGFLIDQWIERISEFLPNARIGRIQGKVIDIEDKDIVLATIQSVSMKKYALNQFDSFGFVILDEAHICPSETFSQALTKFNSENILALSATPDRKDGLTKVLKWYVGDVIYHIKSEVSTTSEVHRYIYDCKNPAYCKEILNYRGKASMSTMMTNISEYMPRTKFVVGLMPKLIEENRQTIIFCNRKECLRDMHQLIEELSIGTVGYYIGGMKQAALDETTKKQIILATFSMAKVGLDIKTADTIILVTPLSDVEQAIGRIGRGDIKNKPLVIDIVDNFSCFEAQANKRLTTYKQMKYLIKTYTVNEGGAITKTHGEWDPERDGKRSRKKPPKKEEPKETKEEKEAKLIQFLLDGM